MSSAEERTKTVDPVISEEARWCLFKKVSNLPLVSDTYKVVFTFYTNVKVSHPAIQTVFDMAEAGMKTVATTAASGAQPLLDKFEPQIAVVDAFACKSVDILQEKWPVMQQISFQTIGGTVNLIKYSFGPVYPRVIEAVNSMTKVVDMAREVAQGQVEMAKLTVRNYMDSMMATNVGQLVVEGVDSIIEKSDELIEDFLPVTHDEMAALAARASLEDPAIDSVELQEEFQDNYGRLASLTAKLRTRAYYHSLGKLRKIQQTVEQALFFLQQVIHLMKYTKKSVDQKVKRKLQKIWSKDQVVDQVEMELQALKVSQNVAQQIQTSCLMLLARVQGLPEAFKEKIRWVHGNMVDLQVKLSHVEYLENVPSGFLKQIQEEIKKAEETVREVTKYVIDNPPHSCMFAPFFPEGGALAEPEENGKTAA